MEVCAKLELFLEEQELTNISETAKSKITEKFDSLIQIIADLRNEKSELNAVLGTFYSVTNLILMILCHKL